MFAMSPSLLNNELTNSADGLSHATDQHWRRAERLLSDLKELGDDECDGTVCMEIHGLIAIDGCGIEGARVVVRRATGPAMEEVATTRPDGSFTMDFIDEADVEVQARVTVTHPDFAPATTELWMGAAQEGSRHWVELSMLPVGACSVLPAAAGGRLVDETTEYTLTVPPNAFITTDGRAFQGDAKVYIACIDPSDADSLAKMPGDFSAVDIHGRATQLQSFGAIHVGLQSADTGEELRVRPGRELDANWSTKVTLDVLEKGGGLPASWRFDEVG